MAQGDLGFTDDQLWEDPDAPRDEVVFDLLEAERPALLLDGPRVVDLARRETAPLVGVRVCPLKERFAQDLRERAALVAVRRETNQAVAGPAFRLKGTRPPVVPPDPIPDELKAEQFSTDLRVLDRLPWAPGTWRVTLLLADRRTDPIEVRLQRQEVQDEAVRRFIEERRRPGFPPPADPVRPELAHARAQADAGATAGSQAPAPFVWEGPAPPPEVGVVLAAPRVVLVPGRATLRGSFRLPVLPCERVRPRPADDADAAGWRDPGDPEATAIVTVTLVCLGESDGELLAVPLRLASVDPLVGEAPVVTGRFELELLGGRVDLTRVVQTYSLWAFHGATVAGPCRVGLVTQDMIEQG